jgi:epoxyqueuosine reductase
MTTQKLAPPSPRPSPSGRGSTQELTLRIKAEAARLGFDLVGVCPAVEPPGLHHFFAWLEAGRAGQMHYFAARRDAYAHPRGVLDGARSLVMLGTAYRTSEPAAAGPGQGRVSRYAWGFDYHDLLREKLSRLAECVLVEAPAAHVRGIVDTAPLLEREFAELAGLGWIGKNTLLLNRKLGSWFFLAALLTDLELEYDQPHAANHCGTCTACLDACPTGAFVGPYQLDAQRCISYLTIELRGAVPAELRPGMGDWVFGCDVCQEVCPWNNHAPASAEPSFGPSADRNPLDLAELFDLSEADFRRGFRHTPLWRAKRRGMLRNAAIALGNRPTPEAVGALVRGLEDPEPLVRGACAWALGRFNSPAAVQALRRRLEAELDAAVRAELAAAVAAKCG